MTNVFICSDLDRTILPNGPQEESPAARPLLNRLAGRREVILTYVSGRGKHLLMQAIADWDIPVPDYAVGDVGTTIYQPNREWRELTDWEEKIRKSWNGYQHADLSVLLSHLPQLSLQEKEKQNTYKLSYYTDPKIEEDPLKREIVRRLSDKKINARVIFSIDEQANIALVDILPENATKLEAIRFIQKKECIADHSTVFGGDSGNDLTVLSSGIQAILVKNASPRIRQTAVEILAQKGQLNKLYLASGQFMGMNGNYSAGLLEGIAHFLPQTLDWLANGFDRYQGIEHWKN